MKNIVNIWLSITLCLLAGVSPLSADEAAPPFVVLDDYRSREATQTLWQVKEVTLALSSEHATSGRTVLKAVFGDHGAFWIGNPGQPFDWSRCRAIAFDVFNPYSNAVPFLIRMDDKDSQGFQDRSERCDTFRLPPGRVTHVVQSLTNLLANNDRLMDCSALTRFSLSAGPGTLYFDSFRLMPLPESEWPKPEVPAATPYVLDDFVDSARTAAQWNFANVTSTVVTDRAMRVTFAASTNDPASLALHGVGGQPMDWRGYRTICFDVFNPAAVPVSLMVRIDDAASFNLDSRYQTERIPLLPGQSTSVMVDIWRMTNLRGFRMDKGQIRQIILDVGTNASERVLSLSSVCLSPEACAGLPPRVSKPRAVAIDCVSRSKDGHLIAAVRNEVMSGRIPGKTPEILGRELLEDPEIKPLLPLFRAAAPRHLAVCSHSMSISAHWSTSGAFFDIAAEAWKAVNPGIEYKGFLMGGMSASQAVEAFLAKMQAYKPDETYLFVVPDSQMAMEKLIVGMQQVGSRVCVADNIKAWGAWSPAVYDEVREMCRKHNAVFLELMTRGYGAEGSQDWVVKDTIHMRTVGHCFFARELMKEWAKMLAAEQGATPRLPVQATLWDPTVFAPPRSALPMLEPVPRVTIQRAEPGEYQFLHGVCLAAHKGRIFACWTNSRKGEDPAFELVRGRWSEDGGKTWGPLEVVAGNSQFQPSYGHGTLLSQDGKLWAFVARFDPDKPEWQINIEAFLRDDATGQWTSHGIVARQFWAHESPRPLPDGGWIVGGAMGPYPGCGPAVAILDKNDVTKWQVVSLPIPYGASAYYAGETTVWVGATDLTAVVRNPIQDLALLSVSKDHGKTWTEPVETNLAMAESKACAGTLSTGQRYLIYNSGNRENLVLAAGKPGAALLSDMWMLRKGRELARYHGSSKGPQWSYPWALEWNGNLLVAYSAAKEDAELAIIPLSALAGRP